MEKGPQKSMNQPVRIVITGPECTGKSTLAKDLAAHYKSKYIPEYARSYVENLDRPYTFEDVLHIAETQRRQLSVGTGSKDRLVFYDTWLIISKVWLDVVYGKYPAWIDEELRAAKIDLWLLCDTDIPWFPDHVRENGGEMREKLFEIYRDELVNIGARYEIIRGTGDHRLHNALKIIDKYFPDICAESN